MATKKVSSRKGRPSPLKGRKRPDMLGNTYAVGHGEGRPRFIQDEKDEQAVADALYSFFKERLDKLERDYRENKKIIVDLPTFIDFENEYGVSYWTLKEYEKRPEEYKVFSQAWQKCKEIQKKYITLAGMNGLSNPRFTIFAAMNYTDMRDKKQLTGADDGPIKIQGVTIEVQE